MRIKKSIKTALKRLNDHGYEAYIVGGALRDMLLKRKVSDYDITTNAYPNAIKMIFDDYICYDIGKKHGTIAVIIDSDKIDITPYRSEDKYLDHRHPSQIRFSNNLKQDLKRRDFTINAMCMDIDTNIIDYFDGINDLNNKIIRTVGKPQNRFNEDALRILRAIRFKAQLGFYIEENTDRYIHKLKDTLNYISQERKKEELLHILNYRNAFEIINEYIDVFNTFMPFKKIEREYNNFSNPLYALSYILKDEEDIRLKSLKYSNHEIDLIRLLIQSTKINVNDDYEFISLLSNQYQKDILNFLKEYHHKNYDERYNELKKYMIDINQLKITGDQIKEYGYEAKEISKVKRHLVDLVHLRQISNSEKALNNYLKNHIIK